MIGYPPEGPEYCFFDDEADLENQKMVVKRTEQCVKDGGRFAVSKLHYNSFLL